LASHLGLLSHLQRIVNFNSQVAHGRRAKPDLPYPSFRGWDHESGHFFAGAVYESNLLLFDAQDRRYYQYQID